MGPCNKQCGIVFADIDVEQLLFTATLGAVDKVEIGTASLYGFQTDNNMHGQQYSWLGSILPLGVRISAQETRIWRS